MSMNYKAMTKQWHKRAKRRKLPTDSEFRELGGLLGVDWREIPFKEFKKGYSVELEHAMAVDGDTTIVAMIALDHLYERPDYYTLLAKFEGH